MDNDGWKRNFEPEFIFSASRSGGAGGQNVNKVSSKVELKFHVDNSELLTAEEKELVKQKLANKINSEGFLQIVSQESRSQLDNKNESRKKFYKLLQFAFKKEKPRKKTKPSKAVVRKRLDEKKKLSGKKQNRKNFLGEID
jgi:ribosome-associated protein